jgi:hypothetical protein
VAAFNLQEMEIQRKTKGTKENMIQAHATFS